MSLTGNLLFATGVLHNTVGFLIPELAGPFWRIVADGGLVATPGDINEHYAREATFWFQFAGWAMMMQGYYMRHTALMIRKHQTGTTTSRNKPSTTTIDEEAPTAVGLAMTTMGLVGAYCMPVSGFWLILAQGMRVLWILHSRPELTGGKKV